MINVLSLFSWTTWFIITLVIILIFWLFYGGKYEYEFVGVKPLSTKSLFENLEGGISKRHNLFEPPKINDKILPVSLYKKETVNKSCKGEDLVAEILEEILSSEVKRNIRPNFLRNPETGKNLELDCYNEEYALAVEYNGVQHYKFPSAFHRTEQEFYNQLYRDRLKKKLCDEAGVYLISVPYWVDNFGTEEGHLEKSITKKILFTPREIKYKRIYDYLYERVSEYFKMIFPEQYKDDENTLINEYDEDENENEEENEDENENKEEYDEEEYENDEEEYENDEENDEEEYDEENDEEEYDEENDEEEYENDEYKINEYNEDRSVFNRDNFTYDFQY